jgi:hypothetical protein
MLLLVGMMKSLGINFFYKIHKNKNSFKYLNYVFIGHKKFDKWKK